MISEDIAREFIADERLLTLIRLHEEYFSFYQDETQRDRFKEDNFRTTFSGPDLDAQPVGPVELTLCNIMERDIRPFSWGEYNEDALRDAVAADPSLVHRRSGEWERTLLDAAIRRGSESLVRFLLEHGSPLDDDPGRITPLMESCRRGAVSIARALLGHGANANVQDYEGRTPLHWALIVGHVEVVDFLLAKGADFLLRTHRGLTPLMRAGRESDRAMVNLLRNATAPQRVPSKPTCFATIQEAAECGDRV